MKKYVLVVLCFLAYMTTPTAYMASASIMQQTEKEIRGVVKDAEGMPLPGVNVVVTGTTIGAITDVDGLFVLKISDTATSVRFSFIGYQTVTKTIAGTSNFDIVLEYEVGELEDVVITGYGQTQNEYLLSTSISMVNPEKMIRDRPIARLESAIQGATPAVVIMQESGSPGASLTVRMRGVGTAGNATPLMLLDGFQVPDLSFINPNDISGIGIYKDAAASSIYGARGGNGVLNTQSKNGTSDKLLHVSYSSYYGVQSLAREGDYLSAKEYAQYYNNSYTYMVRAGLPTVGVGRAPFTDAEVANLANTSWIKSVSQDAAIQDHHLGFSGGKGNINYYLGTGIFNQDGIIGNTKFNRKTINLKVNTTLLKRINISVNGMYTKNGRDFIAENSENSRLLSSVASLPAIYPVNDLSGSPFNTGKRGALSYNGVPLNAIAEFGNPTVGLNHTTNHADIDVYFGNAVVNYRIADGLKINSSYGYLSRKTHIKSFSETFDYPDTQIKNTVNSLSKTGVEETYWQWEGYLSFDKKFANHNVSTVFGTSLLQNKLSTFGTFGSNFSVNEYDKVDFDDIIETSNINMAQPYGEINTTVSYYGRVNYNFQEKYLFGATVRMDASSKFGNNNRWGNFPSINAGWLLSNEQFLKRISLINQLKLRASWGINGNDRIPPYQYFDRYQYNNAGFPVKQDFNPNIKWEEITQTNIGLDVDLFKNKIGLTLDYYVKKTSDMLIDFPNPAYTGLPAPIRNAADVKNTGLETILSYRDKIGSDFSFELNANIGVNRNQITSLGGGLPLYGAATRVFNGAPYLTKSDVGDPIASFYGYKIEGLDNKGNPVYKDISGPNGVPDGVITSEYDRTIIGNPYPDFVYGINLRMEYKGFDFTTFITGTQGNDVVNASMGYGFQYSNRTTKVLNAWSLENPDSKVMRPSALEVVNHEFSDYYIENGSYTRVKNITLGYSFPKEWINKLKLDNLRLYVSANNMITITNYSGYDPEIGSNNDPRDVGVDRGFYPQAKSIIGGLQLSF